MSINFNLFASNAAMLHPALSGQGHEFVKVNDTSLLTNTTNKKKRKYTKKKHHQSNTFVVSAPVTPVVSTPATPLATTPRSVLESQSISVLSRNVGNLMNHLVGAKYSNIDLIKVTQKEETQAMEYIYLVAVREFLKTEECTDCTYKIGRTDNPPEERLRGYGKGSFYLLTYAVGNKSRQIETQLLKEFMGVFKQQKQVGNEYFSGDPKQMIQVMLKVIYNFENSSHNQPSYHQLQKELQDIQLKYTTLYNSLYQLLQTQQPQSTTQVQPNARAKKSLQH